MSWNSKEEIDQKLLFEGIKNAGEGGDTTGTSE
jgi:hypothetical protein